MYVDIYVFALKKVAKTKGVYFVISYFTKWRSLRHVALKKVATFMGVYKLRVIVQPLSLLFYQ